MNTVSTRYAEADLKEFQEIVQQHLDKALSKLERLEENYKTAAEEMEEENDWMDDSSSQNDLNMLQTLVYRQRKYVTDLQNAMQRIHNKSYGICVVTGELIDKKRLLAVPTTTKSIAAKTMQAQPVKKEEEPEKKKPVNKEKKREIITRVIKKTPPKPVVPTDDEEEEDSEDFDELDDLLGINDELSDDDDDIDFDEIVDEDTED